MEGLLDHTPARRADARRRHRPLRVGVHPRHRPAAARAGVHARRARAAHGSRTRRRHAGARAAAGLRPGLPGRQRGARWPALGAGRHRPELRLPGARPSTATAAARCCWTSRSWCTPSSPRCAARCRRRCRCRPRCAWATATTRCMLDNARRPSPTAGACELVVHARTKAHGYRPPAYWDRIARDPRGGARSRWSPTARSGPSTTRAAAAKRRAATR